MSSCAFCRIVRGGDLEVVKVFEDDRTLAFVPLNPATQGHTLVIPKSHVARVWDMEAEDARAVMATVVLLANAIENTLKPAGLNVIQSNGEVATQTVDHVHFHVLPRWTRDRMLLRWPRRASPQHGAPRLVREALESRATSELPVATSEDRRHHLGFIQSVISRMASASASAKTWLLPIVTAAFGYAFVERDWFIALLGIVAVVVFALLDANYLKQERSFRKLYDRVAQGERLPLFSMNPTVAGPDDHVKVNYWPDAQDWKSWAIAPFYLPMLIIGVVLFAYLAPWC